VSESAILSYIMVKTNFDEITMMSTLYSTRPLKQQF